MMPVHDVCVPPEIVYPPCDTIDYDPAPADLTEWYIASALLEAARCIAAEGPCPETHRCAEDGEWLTGGEDPGEYHGIQLGAARVGECCCGGIVVGSRYPQLIDKANPCTDITEVEFDLIVTWPCETPTYLRYVERARFNRLLTETVCCKLAETGPKAGCKAVPYMVGVNDLNDGECPQIIYTFKART